MKSFKRHLVVFFLAVFCMGIAAQTTQWRDIYKAKKKDTIFGIANKYSISIPELMEANPEMKKEGYQLKKDDYIFIPYTKDFPNPNAKQASTAPKAQPAKTAGSPAVSPSATTKQEPVVKIGVMLPLHDVDGDGRRMVEYYRGILLACDQLRQEGISTDIAAWNVPIDADIRQTLLEAKAKDRDIIFGPLYTSQVGYLSHFCRNNGIKLVIPFSINGNEVATNPNLFQVYQNQDRINSQSISVFLQRFQGCHPVFVDCNDTTSKKGGFTFGLRKQLEKLGIQYSITNLKSSEDYFAKAFSASKPNVVILNTGRSPELNVCLAKLDGMKVNHPNVQVSLFGYTDWLLYTNVYLEYFHKYDTYIPTVFYYNPLSSPTRTFEQNYRRWFRSEMMWALPHFALTGYDQAEFFVRGLHAKGKQFSGTAKESSYKPLQTPLRFERVGNGGYQNEAFMLIHYATNNKLEAINY
ncbi:MAG: LysM domain-containing protein [Prevotella sp.]|nr:LysM peptidoglycan-binding domain-containing protein [Bacteroidales bacterium]MDY4230432.1 LysM domain-containing protein [Prevotella sp.]